MFLRSKPLEAFFGVISVCISLLATFGTTFYFGLPFNPVSSTMPFLILAVGKHFIYQLCLLVKKII